jgi:hypothetical protein
MADRPFEQLFLEVSATLFLEVSATLLARSMFGGLYKSMFMPRFLYFAFALIFVSACASTQPPYHGFPDQASLDRQDAMVMQQSVIGGPLDPRNLAQDDQRYAHNNIAYDRIEEGYYRWGQRLYGMGYRDAFYVRDLAPKAFHHELLDTYDHAIAKGFEDAAGKK